MAINPFYIDIEKDVKELITEFGRDVTIKEIRIASDPITPFQTTGGRPNKVVNTFKTKGVTKTDKTALIQDRFYQTSELELLIPAGVISIREGYKYTVFLDGKDWEIIRSRSERPGGYEILASFIIRRSGSGGNTIDG